MTKTEAIARSDAKFDGRDFDGLPRADRQRYLERAAAGIVASKCPFDDPRTYMDLHTPCPVCGALGSDDSADMLCVDQSERKP